MHVQAEEVTTNDASTQELIDETIDWSGCSLGNKRQRLIRLAQCARLILKQMEIKDNHVLGQMRHCLQNLLDRTVSWGRI